MKINNINKEIDQFKNSLSQTIESFRNGDDKTAMEMFICYLDDIEHLFNLYECSDKVTVKIMPLLDTMKVLYLDMVNDDIVAMIDRLEYEIYPLFIEMLEGSKEQ